MEDYWKQPICKEIFEKKYMINEGDEDYLKVYEKISEEIASVENEKEVWKKIFFEEISNGRLVPGGRITANARPKSKNKYYNNCYTIDLDDSMEDIYEGLKADAIISSTGGGVGFNISNLRPNGSVTSKGGISSGPISFLKVFNESAKIIQTGGFRRAAHIAILNVDHPDIEEFITCKKGEHNNELTQFNISVGVTDAFMNAVSNDEDWDLVFNEKVYKTVKAKDLYDLMMKNAHFHNEPGVFFLDRANEDNNAPDSFTIDRTNPCLTGDTLIAVADGRNAVTIKELAEESKGKKKFPVYSGREKMTQKSHSSFSAEIQNAIAFSSGIKEVITVVLSDGTYFNCTPDHRLATKDGRWVEAQFSEGEQLEKFYSYSNNDTGKNYRTINSRTNGYARQYKMYYEFLNGKVEEGFQIHHVDHNSRNDFIDNLKKSSNEEHKKETKNHWKNNNPVSRMDKDLFNWLQRKKNIKGNAKKYNWSKERYEKELSNFIKNNPKPEIKKSKDILLNHSVFVKEIIWTGNKEEVFDLTVENNSNFYIITDGDNGYYNSCGVLVHNCGEISMPSWSLCCLSSVNLTKFVKNEFEDSVSFDFSSLKKTVEVGVRFLDNVLDATKYPLKRIETFSKQWRRIGLGFTGYADMLAMMKIPYNSEEALLFTEKLAKTFRDTAYQASINLAKEKGSYPEFRKEEIAKSGFFKKLPKFIREEIQEYGLRNVGLLTVAPNGTISLTMGQNCSSGIEPIFSLDYERRIRTGFGDETQTEKVYDYAWLKYFEYLSKNNFEFSDKPEFFQTTFDINPYQSIDVQAVWQKYIDHSISKTINLPNNFSFEEYKNLFKYAHSKGLKGTTSFNPQGSVKGILSSSNKPEKKELTENNAPKRPESLPCDIHEISVNKEKHIILCGFFDGQLYEIFVSPNDGSIDVSKHTKGFIKKVKKGIYELSVKNGEEKVVIPNIGKAFDPVYGSLSRFISMSLRHGVSLQFIVDQLTKDSEFISFERAVSRILKKYIKDGEISTHKCSECGGTLEYREGCLTCRDCGFSKCS